MTTLEPNPPRMGRPLSVTPDVADRILTLLSEGRSLREICQAEDMPDKSTIMRHLHRDAQFAAAYARAKEAGLEELAELALSDASSATPLTAQCERLRFDARRWYLSKLSPKKWGDRVVNEHTGAGGGPVMLQPVPPMIPAEIKAGIQALLADSESAAGLTPAEGADDATRLRTLMLSGSPLHPKLWAALRNDGGSHD